MPFSSSNHRLFISTVIASTSICICVDLKADEIINIRIAGGATVLRMSPGGKFVFCEHGGIDEQSRASIRAPGGLIRFIGGKDVHIGGKSRVLLEAKDVKFRGGSSIIGQSIVLVIVSYGGSLDLDKIDENSQLYYCKSFDSDPEPKVMIRKIGFQSTVTKVDLEQMEKLMDKFNLSKF